MIRRTQRLVLILGLDLICGCILPLSVFEELCNESNLAQDELMRRVSVILFFDQGPL